MEIKKIHEEQRRQMEIYKWIKSEQSGYDLGEACLYEWVQKYAKSFREWAESIPPECVRCGQCLGGGIGVHCTNPFNERRLRLIDALWKE